MFIEAEKFADQFRRIASRDAPKLANTTLGIFAKTAEWYPGEDPFNGEKFRFVGKTLRNTLGNVYRRILRRNRLPSYFYTHDLLKKRTIDTVITKDERLLELGIPSIVHMPEISRIQAPISELSPSDSDSRVKREVEDFLNRNQDKKRFLYFGDTAFYKGYDLFLAFLVANPDFIGLHPGRHCDDNQRAYYEHDVDELRACLLEQGRLFETQRYVSSEYEKRLFFSSVDVYATTHRLALSSSTMFQAIELGKPVIVPNRGLLGYRVRTNDLGLVYEYGDLTDLRRKLDQIGRSQRDYKPSLAKFAAKHSVEAVERFWREMLLTDG